MKRPRRSVSLGEENRRAKRGFGAIRLWRNRGGGGSIIQGDFGDSNGVRSSLCCADTRSGKGLRRYMAMICPTHTTC
jgi:hypothetical protein